MGDERVPIILILGSPKMNQESKELKGVVSELDSLEDLFENSRQIIKKNYVVKIRSVTRRIDVERYLGIYKNDIAILHYSGHSNNSSLSVDDQDIFSRHIADHIQTWESKPKLVFLNGCHNAPQAIFFQNAGVPIVIATQKPINDEYANNFSISLYKALINESSIEDAFNQAGALSLMGVNREIRRSLNSENEEVVDNSWDWDIFTTHDRNSAWVFSDLLEMKPSLLENIRLFSSKVSKKYMFSLLIIMILVFFYMHWSKPSVTIKPLPSRKSIEFRTIIAPPKKIGSPSDYTEYTEIRYKARAVAILHLEYKLEKNSQKPVILESEEIIINFDDGEEIFHSTYLTNIQGRHEWVNDSKEDYTSLVLEPFLPIDRETLYYSESKITWRKFKDKIKEQKRDVLSMTILSTINGVKFKTSCEIDIHTRNTYQSKDPGITQHEGKTYYIDSNNMIIRPNILCN
ncbi:MAG: AAA ATPase domain-containing protein (Fragment) [uncultured Thiotrichaceae bacterium]|uniref:AAA ATPase domain-containing protein n=1 Tax=uncultured Thiotrichaceae bacterium TaxID=298394 RepID=A0A6S6S313_9GAMM